ncbi:MAG: hypothetical protein HY208_02675, partial [Nitrospirae bacterium]|nr:hypothetical protein [Nitrospirota bacterium]
HILLNRHLMLIKNEPMGRLWRHWPLLLWADCVDLGYLLAVQPRLFARAAHAVMLMRRALDKRRRMAGRAPSPAGAG